MSTRQSSRGSSRLARLYAAAWALTASGTDEAALLQRIVEEAARLVEARYAALGLLDAHGKLTQFVTTGLTPEQEARLAATPPRGVGIIGALLREGEPLRLDDLTRDPRSVGFPPHHPPMRTFLGVPLLLANLVIGRLYMAERTGGPFTEEDEYLALGFAAAAAVAIQNARLYRAATRDLAERRKAERSLRSERDFVAAVLDTTGALVVVLDREGHIVRFNRACEQTTGYTAAEVRGRHIWDFLLAPEEVASVKTVFEELRAGQLTNQHEHYWVAKDGTRRPIAWSNTTLLDAHGEVEYVIGTGLDITARKQAEAAQQQLLVTERFRAMGELAAGIAHDFNNLLAAILGRTEVLLNRVSDPTEHENLEAIRQAARDGTTTVARLRALSRPMDAGEFRPVDLAAVSRQAIELTRPRWRDEMQRRGYTIAVSLEAPPSCLPVQGDPAALREALINLILNAVDAMPAGGRLILRLHQADDDGVTLQVVDTGVGMSPDVRERVFEPFFTTKGTDGSGLGLAMVQRVVLSHEGRVEVASTLGKGTTFTLWLPAAAMPAPSLGEETAPTDGPAAALDRVGTIVVVDDQPEVLTTTAMLLREDGHEVQAFQDPREAVAAVLASRPDLVITDLGMPELNGWDVARAVHDRWPDLPILLLTGWAHEVTKAQLREHGITAPLSKPFEAADLRRAVARVLSADPATKELHILLVDDSPGFAAVLTLLLAQDGHQVQHVAQGAEAVAQLTAADGTPFDLILVDLNLPDLPAQEIVRAARALTPQPAVCVMSGSDEQAMRTEVPDADLHVDKAAVPQRLADFYALARHREVPT